VLEDGSATFTVDGATLEAAAGQVVVVPAGAAHRFVTGASGCRFVSLHPVGRIAQEWLEG
jgi:quercetin dioxygenase-like cupin family protein